MRGQAVLSGDDARAALLRGIAVMTAAVAPTLGPTARTVAIAPATFGTPPEVLDRAATITRRTIAIQGPFENMGAMLLRHLVWRVHEAVGDGGATAAVIAHRLIDGAIRYVGAGGDALALQHGIQHAADVVRAELCAQSRPIELPREIAAMIAGSIRDNRTALLIGEALDAVGADGVIQVRDSPSTRTECEYIPGVRWDVGAASPYLFDEQRDRVTLDHPLVLVSDSAINKPDELVPAIDIAIGAHRPLLIIAPDFNESALALLVSNKERGLLAVKAPTPVGQREQAIEEIALICGARLFCQARGDRLRDIKPNDMGEARQAWATRGMTGLLGANGNRAAIRCRVAEVRSELARAIDEDARGKIRDRLARLSGIAAIVRVGGTTKQSREEIEQRVEAAIATGRAALQGGAIPGGGCGLIATASAVKCLRLDGDEAIGAKLLSRALEEPLRVIARNSGREEAPVVNDAHDLAAKRVFDARTATWVDPWQAGILDARLVLDRIIEVVVSSAVTTLRTDTLVRGPAPPVTWTP
jgi:chaperonin GroEL